MAWILGAMLLGFFFCCCGGYCGYFYDRVISLGNWTQEAGSWSVHADHYFYTTDDNAILLSNVDANTPENAIRVRVVLSSGDEARIYTTYTDANDHAYLKIIGGTSISYVETTGGTPVEYETFPENGNMSAGTDITFRICYDNNTVAVNHSSASPQNLFHSTKTITGKFGFGTGAISGTTKFYRVVGTHINGIGAYDPDVTQISTAEGSDCIACSLCQKFCNNSSLPNDIEIVIDENTFSTMPGLPCAVEPLFGTHVLTKATEPINLDDHCLSNYQYSPCTYHLQVEIPCDEPGPPFFGGVPQGWCANGVTVDLVVTIKAIASSDTYNVWVYVLTRATVSGDHGEFNCRSQFVFRKMNAATISDGGIECPTEIIAEHFGNGTSAGTFPCVNHPWTLPADITPIITISL
jgi:hypothetical protein